MKIERLAHSFWVFTFFFYCAQLSLQADAAVPFGLNGFSIFFDWIIAPLGSRPFLALKENRSIRRIMGNVLVKKTVISRPDVNFNLNLFL